MHRFPCILLVLLTACPDDDAPKQPMFDVPHFDLQLPQLSGWIVDRVEPIDPAKGGVVFRLVRQSSVPLSPRVEVRIEEASARPTRLEDLLNTYLRALAKFEADDNIRITQVDQRPTHVGARSAYRVQHDYTMSPGQGAPIAITQVATVFVLDGRGIEVTALGRTELYHPLADSIDRMMIGIRVPMPKSGTPLPTDVQPIDLGEVGGKPKR